MKSTLIFSATRRSRDIKTPLCLSVSIWKKDSVLVCKTHECYCTIRKNVEHFHYFSLGLLITRCKKTIAMDRLYEGKLLQSVFKRIQHYIYLFKLYSILVILLLKINLTNIFSKISKIGMNLYKWFNLQYQKLQKVQKMERG